ncbi:MAG: hypothetical protein NVSMB9_01280 [Isosphaeraceae bacterium]
MENSLDKVDGNLVEDEPATREDQVRIARAELGELYSKPSAVSSVDKLAGVLSSSVSAPLSEEALEPVSRSSGSDAEATLRGREARITKELAARDRRLAELELSCKAAVRDCELATALAGKPLVTGAVAQLIRLWRDDFDAYEEDGSYKVAARNGRTVEQVINERINSSEYSHFCVPSSKGGSGARDANRPASTAASHGTPRNLGESVVMKWREESATRPSNLLKPIGLRRHR